MSKEPGELQLHVQATAEGLSTTGREISPLERMQGMASAWMNATPEERERLIASAPQEKTMSDHTITAAPEGLPVTPFYREEHFPEDATLVRRLPVEQLLVLFDAMEAANEAMLGILNRPRCTGAIEDIIDGMMTRQSDVRSYIVEELQRRPMSGDRTDDEAVMGYVVAWELKSCGGSVAEAIATLARMKVAHDDVVGKQHRARRAVAAPA